MMQPRRAAAAAAAVLMLAAACATSPRPRYEAGIAVNALEVSGADRAEVEAAAGPRGGTVVNTLHGTERQRFIVVFDVDDRDRLEQIRQELEAEGLDARVHTVGSINE